MKIIHFFFYLFILLIPVSQFAFAISINGIVTDENIKPLPYTTITIPALHKVMITNQEGKFIIENLKPGVYTIEAKLIGFKTEARSIAVDKEDINIAIIMKNSVLELPGVVVTGTPQPTDILSSSQSIFVIQGKELDRERGQNIGQLLKNSPGVSLYSTGAGISKPVIRGLTFQRVLIVSGFTRQEGQQWGDEHAPEIDAFDVERIEILRGPSSILYGSDALGGVINIIKPDLPSQQSGAPVLAGEIKANVFSNNEHLSGNVSLSGAYKLLGYRAYFTARKASDIMTPEGSLNNSGMSEISSGATIGFKESFGTAMLDFSHLGQELQIHENPSENPDATPFQKIQHSKLHLHSDFPTSLFRYELDASFQRNNRMEYEEKSNTLPALNLLLNTFTLDMKVHHEPLHTIFGTLGFSLMHQKNETLADEKLIPGYNMLNLAAFLYEEAALDIFIFSLGIRFDLRKLNINKTPELNIDAQQINYTALTGNLGAVLRVSEPISMTINIGRGWRAPAPFELFVDGVHEGTVQYLKGDKNLTYEQSLNLDASIKYVTNRLRGEITLYRNLINNYIFASLTGEIDTGSGFKKYQLKQADASLMGAELSFQAQLFDWFVLTSGYDFIRGLNFQTSKPLPLIPANRFRLEAKLVTESIWFLVNPYFVLSANAFESQNRIEEYEKRTGGYTLYSVGAGFELEIGQSRANIYFAIENIFNIAYSDHLYRYKDYALNPGRNYELKLSVPFTLIN